MLEDAELLRRYVREKSETAFAELVARHLDLVYSAALRQVGGDAHRARDVSQVVFTTLARKAATLVSHPALIGWLYTATQHAAAKAVREESRRRAREHEAHLMQEILSTDGDHIDWDCVRPVLDAAMSELNARDREAVLLRFFARRAFSDIGRTLSLSEDAARMRVERALEKLHALLARRGVTSTAAALGVALSQQAMLAAPAGLAANLAGAAVASATGSAGPAAVLISLMTTTKTATTVAGLVLLAAIGSALHETRASREIEAATALAIKENESFQAKLIDLRKREEAASVAAAETRRLQTASPAPTAQTPPPIARNGTAAEMAALLEKYPELHRSFIDSSRASALERFGPFLRSQSLSSAQLERFLDLVAGGGVVFQIGAVRYQYGSSINGEAAKAELQSLLGAEGFAQLEDFSRRTSPNSGIATQLAAALFRSPTPLTAEQGMRLQEIMISRTTPDRTGRVDWTAVMQDSQDVLSAPQRAKLEQLSVQDRLRQAVSEADRVARAQTSAPNPTGPER